MTVSTGYAGTLVSINSLSPPSGVYVDQTSTDWSTTTLEAWTNQAAGTPTASNFGVTSANYVTNQLKSSSHDENSYPILLTNFSFSPTISAGATITDITASFNKVSTTAGNIYDLAVQLYLYNGSNLSSGAINGNLANGLAWPQVSTFNDSTSFTGNQFIYDFGTAANYSTVTNSNFGLLIGVDGSTTGSTTHLYIDLVAIAVTWTGSSAGPGSLSPLFSPATILAPMFSNGLPLSITNVTR